MWCHATVLLALSVPISIGVSVRSGTQITSEFEAERKSPVKRVVELLNKIKSELEQEASNESSMYDKMVCWCNTQDKEKAQEVAALEQKDVSLQSEINEQSENAARSKVQLANAEKELRQHKNDLDANQQMCDSQGKDSFDATKDIRFFITSLKNAIKVLSRHHVSLTELGAAEASSLRSVIRAAALRYGLLQESSPVGSRQTSLLSVGSRVTGNLEQKLLQAVGADSEELPLKFAAATLEKAAVESSSVEGVTGFLQGSVSPHLEQYNVQSGEIVGILKQMLSDFESDLQEEQGSNQKTLEECKATKDLKEQQIALAEKAVLQFQSDAATATSKAAEANTELEITRTQHSEAKKFLSNLKLTCNDLDSQWESRSKTRSEELRAIEETLQILTEDDANDHFTRTNAFLQVHAQENSGMRVKRSRAVASLRAAAASPSYQMDDLLDAWRSRGTGLVVGGPREQLSTLAVASQLDSFTDVKKQMDKMIANLKAEGAADVAKKESCTRDIEEAEKNTQALIIEEEHLTAQIKELKSKISRLTEEMQEIKAEIAAVQVEVQKRGSARDDANTEFQQIVQDQRTTQEILNKALARLKVFYHKGHKAKEASLVQESQTPPVKFNTYQNNRAAPSVLSLLEQIIADASAAEKEATDGEAADQKAYETFVLNSNQQVKDFRSELALKAEERAKAGSALVARETNHNSTVEELTGSKTLEGDLHLNCDWMLKHFDTRNQQRLQEIEDIQAAKGILSGAK